MFKANISARVLHESRGWLSAVLSIIIALCKYANHDAAEVTITIAIVQLYHDI